MPCVIIEKGSGKQPTYKLLTEYGILSKRYTASDLMPFPSDIKCGNPSIKISLSEAAKKAVSSTHVFCHCKGDCNTLSCRCRRASIICSSRCHKASSEKCKNKKSSIVSDAIKNPNNSKYKEMQKINIGKVPSFGGRIIFDERLYQFQNTCAIDTWFVIFKVLLPVLRNQENTEQLQHLLQLIEKGHFNEAKLQVALDCNISLTSGVIDFFGNEFNLIIKPYLQKFYQHEVNSSCENPYCLNKDILIECTSCQSLSIIDPGDNWIVPRKITHAINEWFEGQSITTCGQKVNASAPKELTFTDGSPGSRQLYGRISLHLPL